MKILFDCSGTIIVLLFLQLQSLLYIEPWHFHLILNLDCVILEHYPFFTFGPGCIFQEHVAARARVSLEVQWAHISVSWWSQISRLVSFIAYVYVNLWTPKYSAELPGSFLVMHHHLCMIHHLLLLPVVIFLPIHYHRVIKRHYFLVLWHQVPTDIGRGVVWPGLIRNMVVVCGGLPWLLVVVVMPEGLHGDFVVVGVLSGRVRQDLRARKVYDTGDVVRKRHLMVCLWDHRYHIGVCMVGGTYLWLPLTRHQWRWRLLLALIAPIPAILIAQCELLGDPPYGLTTGMSVWRLHVYARCSIASVIELLLLAHVIVELGREEQLHAVTALHARGLVHHELTWFE